MLADADFFALTRFLGASAFGRDITRAGAIDLCVKEARDGLRRLGAVAQQPLKIAVYDLTGSEIDDIQWDADGIFVDGRPLTIEPEIIRV
jgi:hypothetical protein